MKYRHRTFSADADPEVVVYIKRAHVIKLLASMFPNKVCPLALKSHKHVELIATENGTTETPSTGFIISLKFLFGEIQRFFPLAYRKYFKQPEAFVDAEGKELTVFIPYEDCESCPVL